MRHQPSNLILTITRRFMVLRSSFVRAVCRLQPHQWDITIIIIQPREKERERERERPARLRPRHWGITESYNSYSVGPPIIGIDFCEQYRTLCPPISFTPMLHVNLYVSTYERNAERACKWHSIIIIRTCTGHVRESKFRNYTEWSRNIWRSQHRSVWPCCTDNGNICYLILTNTFISADLNRLWFRRNKGKFYYGDLFSISLC